MPCCGSVPAGRTGDPAHPSGFHEEPPGPRPPCDTSRFVFVLVSAVMARRQAIPSCFRSDAVPRTGRSPGPAQSTTLVRWREHAQSRVSSCLCCQPRQTRGLAELAKLTYRPEGWTGLGNRLDFCSGSLLGLPTYQRRSWTGLRRGGLVDLAKPPRPMRV